MTTPQWALPLKDIKRLRAALDDQATIICEDISEEAPYSPATKKAVQKAKINLFQRSARNLRSIAEAEELADLRKVRRSIDRDTRRMVISLAITSFRAYRTLRKLRTLIRHQNRALIIKVAEIRREHAELARKHESDERLKSIMRIAPHLHSSASSYLQNCLAMMRNISTAPPGIGALLKGLTEFTLYINTLLKKETQTRIYLKYALRELRKWIRAYLWRSICNNVFTILLVSLLIPVLSNLLLNAFDYLFHGMSRTDASNMLSQYASTVGRVISRMVRGDALTAYSLFDPSLAFTAILMLGVFYLCKRILNAIASRYLFRKQRSALHFSVLEFASRAMPAEGWRQIVKTEVCEFELFAAKGRAELISERTTETGSTLSNDPVH